MKRVFHRYLFREASITTGAVTLTLLFILIATRFARYIGQAASGQLPRQLVFQLLGLSTLNYLVILIPGSVFIGAILTLGRLYRDNEMSAISACGISPIQTFRPLLTLGFVFAAITTILSFWVAPWSVRESVQLRAESNQLTRYGLFQGGHFHQIPGLHATFYAAYTSPHGRHIRGVFIESQKNRRINVITAQSGVFIKGLETDSRTLVLEHGYRYQGEIDSTHFDRIRFAQYGVNLKIAHPERPIIRSRDGQTMNALFAKPTLRNQAEVQWRISAPLSIFVLILIALPLSRTAPRQGRAWTIFAAILFYLLYSNLLGIARVWVAHGLVAPQVGIWWVHALFLLIGGILLARLYEVNFRFWKNSSQTA
ncbi:MAG: LPS export ABC transporter permease LptF [Gammaproteobacteria bacterium]